MHHAIAAMAEIDKFTVDIALIQEPYFQTNGKPGITNKDCLYFIGPACRAALFIQPYMKSQFTFISALSGPDIAVGLIEPIGRKPFIIASVYLDQKLTGDNVILPKWDELVKYCNNKNIPLVCGLDCNAWSSLWEETRDSTNDRAEKIEEFILCNDLYIANEGSTPTFLHGGTIIDITVHTSNLNINKWRVSFEKNFSDHRSIYFEIGDMPKVIIPEGRNYLKANWDLFKSNLDENQNTDDWSRWSIKLIEKRTSQLYSLINNALNLSCPIRKMRRKLRKSIWWTEECELWKQKCRSISHWLDRKSNKNSPDFGSKKRELKYCKLKYTHCIQSSKKASYRQYVGGVNSISEMSKLHKTLKNLIREEIGLLKKEDGMLCEDGRENLELLLKSHFPNGTPTDSYLESEEPNEFRVFIPASNWINLERFDEAIKLFGPHKSGGLDGLKPIVLQHLPKSIKLRFISIFNACIGLSYTPIEWRKSNVVFAKKHGKSSDDPRGYRPISLTSFLFKTLERLVQWHADETNFKEIPIHKNQHAFRKGHSTDDALTRVVNRLEQGLLQGQFAVAIFLDIKGAFDNITSDAIIDAMSRYRVPEDVTSWYKQYLKNRYCESTLGHHRKLLKLSDGAPQGGVLSPTFGWNLAFNDLLHKFDNDSELTDATGYADDGQFALVGPVLSTLLIMAQEALDAAVRWASSCGLELCPKKTVVMIFTNKTKLGVLPKLKLYGKDIEFATSVKYLGINIDNKLNFNQHLTDKIKKGKTIMNLTRNVIRRVWGPNPKFVRWAYTGIIRPMLSYGSMVWAKACESQTSRKKLSSFQRLGLMQIAPVRRGTPTAAMEILYDVPPLDLFIKDTAVKTFLRIKPKLKWKHSGKRSGHLEYISKFVPSECLKLNIDEKTETRDWNSKFNIIIDDGKDVDPSKWDWCCYTDGSLIDSRSGSGAFLFNVGNPFCSISCNTGNATVYQSELYAIQMAANKLLNLEVSGQSICFLVDNQASLKTLKSTIIKQHLAESVRCSLNELGNLNFIVLRWIKAHAGLMGNELADAAAKAGAKSKRVTDLYWSAKTKSKNILKIQLKSWWQGRWDSAPGLRQSRYFLDGPDSILHKELINHGKSTIGKVVRFITGHAFMKRHNAIIKYKTKELMYRAGADIFCRLCKEPDTEETPHHVVTACAALLTWRSEVLGFYSVERPIWKVQDLVKYISDNRISNLENTNELATRP